MFYSQHFGFSCWISEACLKMHPKVDGFRCWNMSSLPYFCDSRSKYSRNHNQIMALGSGWSANELHIPRSKRVKQGISRHGEWSKGCGGLWRPQRDWFASRPWERWRVSWRVHEIFGWLYSLVPKKWRTIITYIPSGQLTVRELENHHLFLTVNRNYFD